MLLSSKSRLRLVTAVVSSSAILASVMGCGSTAGDVLPVAEPQAIHLNGQMHGGQQPVQGASIYLYVVGGYFAGNVAGSILSGVSTDSGGHGYVTTDANGNFTIGGNYTCPSYNTSISTYLLAVGGNPGLASGTNNSAIVMMAALGKCNAISSTTFVNINELSTVAAVTALQQFMVDGTHIAAPSNPDTANPSGLPNAFTTITNLVDLGSGVALSTPTAGNGVSPQATINTLGNILGACVNSPSATSAPCATLFTAATPTGGTAPTNILGAMLNIAKNPGYNVAPLFSLTTSSAPFQPSLSAAPNDFSLGIKFTGGGLSYPGSLAIDNTGNVYTTNCPTCNGVTTGTDSIVGFSPSGSILTGTAGFTSGIHKPTAIAFNQYNGIWSTNLATGSTPDQVNLISETGAGEYGSSFPISLPSGSNPSAIAIDGNLNAWVTDSGTNNIVELPYNGGSVMQTVTPAGLSNPNGIAVDNFGDVYAVGTGSSNIIKLSSSGTVLSGSGGYTGGGLSSPVGLAIDGGDHLWTVDTGTTKSVTEFFGYNGTANSGTTGFSAVNSATDVAIDGAGTAWIANCRQSCAGSGSTAADNIVHLSTTGTSLNSSDGLQNASLAKPTATAIDYSGNLWISNASGSSITEMVGVAAPVVTNLNYAVTFKLLPSANLLKNPGFENGGQGTTVPNWTLTSTGTATYQTTIAYTEGGAHTGFNTLTEGSGDPFSADESQTVSAVNGNYLVSCFAEGTKTQTAESLSVTKYDNAGSTLSVNLLPTISTAAWTLYSIPDVPVSNGSLTLNLNSSSTAGGGYLHFDDCSITKE